MPLLLLSRVLQVLSEHLELALGGRASNAQLAPPAYSRESICWMGVLYKRRDGIFFLAACIRVQVVARS